MQCVESCGQMGAFYIKNVAFVEKLLPECWARLCVFEICGAWKWLVYECVIGSDKVL